MSHDAVKQDSDELKRLLVQREVEEFLYREAELLDEAKLDEWMALLTDDIEYRMPVRISKEKGSTGDVSDTSYHLFENKGSFTTRINRLNSEYTWSDNPPYRIRRFVSNVRIESIDDDTIVVKSNAMIVRGREIEKQGRTMTAVRTDKLRRTAEGLKLADRETLLDHTVVNFNFISVKEII